LKHLLYYLPRPTTGAQRRKDMSSYTMISYYDNYGNWSAPHRGPFSSFQEAVDTFEHAPAPPGTTVSLYDVITGEEYRVREEPEEAKEERT
jgi:hypothetical protein